MDTLIDAGGGRALTVDELAYHVSQELSKAHGSRQSEQMNARTKGLDYYYNRRPKKPAKPRSGVRSTDIPDVCDALMAEILPMFSGRSDLAYFDPLNVDDKQKAREESDAVNYIFFEECDGKRFIHDMLQDGLLQRNATANVEIVEDFKTEYKELASVSQEALTQYMNNHAANKPDEALEIMGQDRNPDESLNVSLRRTWVERKMQLTAHAPENTFVCSDQDSLNLDNARFVAFRVTPTRGELVELGVPYKTAYEEIPAYNYSRDMDSIARERAHGQQYARASHPSGEQTECYRCFYQIDTDGDGIEELHEILYAENKKILSDRIIDESNLACFSPWPVAHTWVGTSLVDKLEEIVNAKTVFLRQTVDNLIRVNNARLICVKGKVDPSSVTTADPLAPIWTQSQGDVQALAFPGAGDAGFKMLGYFDQQRRERVGSALDVQSLGAQNNVVQSDSAHGVERMMSALEKQSANIAGHLAEMLEDVFVKIHRLLRVSDYGPFAYTAVAEHVSLVDQQQMETRLALPNVWPERSRVRVRIGLSEHARMQLLAALETTYQKQMQLMQHAPGELVTLDNIYAVLIEQAVIAGIDVPQRFWINPASQQAQQARMQKMQQQAAMQRAQQMQQEQARQFQERYAQAALENERIKNTAKAANDVRAQRLKEIEAVDDSSQEWTQLEIDANKNLSETGRYK